MEIKIKETGKIVKLACIDPRTGVNWVRELTADDDCIVWNAEEEIYEADQDTIDWWIKYTSDWEKTQQEIIDLAWELKIPEEDIRSRIADEPCNDYEDHRPTAVRIMQQIREEHLPF